LKTTYKGPGENVPHFEFLWTDEIVAHLAEHGVTQDDFEYVVCHPVSSGISRSSGLPAAWGYTQDGRYLIAVFDKLDECTVLPVTAFEVGEPR
jgi:hypothetical protein